MNKSILYVPQDHITSGNRTFTPAIHRQFTTFKVLTKNPHYKIEVVYMSGATRTHPLHHNDHLTFLLKGVSYINIQRPSTGQMFGVDIEFAN